MSFFLLIVFKELLFKVEISKRTYHGFNYLCKI